MKIINADGTRVFILGFTGDTIDEFTLDNGPFDIAGGITPTVDGSVSLRPENTEPNGFEFSPDGLQFYVVDSATDAINAYSLTSAFDISTLSFIGSLDISAEETVPRDIAFSADGSRVFIIGSDSDSIRQYNISNFDIDSDGDGLIDRFDLDSDNDGISDLVEASQGASAFDTDNNGILDGAVDVDSDGLFDIADSDTTSRDGLSLVIDADTDSDGLALSLIHI